MRRLLAAFALRLGVLAALRGAAGGIAIAALWTARSYISTSVELESSLTATSVSLAVGAAVGAVVGWWLSANRRARVAQEIERRVPTANNLLVTAHELLMSPAGALAPSSEVRSLVLHRADQLAATLHARSLLPARRSLLWLAGSIALWGGSVALNRRVATDAAPPSPRALIAAVTGRVDIQRVAVRITPPQYAQQSVTSLRDPVRIDALEGSVVRFTIEASADTVVAVTRQGTRALARDSSGRFVLSMSATTDGFIALEPRAASGRTGPRRLVGITVRTDEAPRVRIVAPARDLIVPDAKRTLDVRVEADDDLAVGSLRLRYTKVSGSGERFTFSEGEVPVGIARASATQWTARAALALESLLEEPGDVVVYRAVATDTRPGSPVVESDAFIAELAAPGGVAALGFSLDPDEDRYALSQQMVILKTERLIAQRATMSAAALT
ncbi:MAG: hypothetical protein ABMA00_19950, partial [Gemmatimonas sp.]